MSVSQSSNANSAIPSRGADVHASTGTLLLPLRCCHCRRGVSIDTRTFTCDGAIHRSTESARTALPQRNCTASSRRGHSTRHETNCSAAGERQRQRGAQGTRTHTDPTRVRESIPAHTKETYGRYARHVALRGSMRSAAGKYGPLFPSPLDPTREKFTCEPRPLHTTRAAQETGIVTRLSLAFAYPYGWSASEEAQTFVRELWHMFHDGPVPAPAASGTLTAQRDEFTFPRVSVGPLSSATGEWGHGSLHTVRKPSDTLCRTRTSSDVAIPLPLPLSTSSAFPPADAQETLEIKSPALHSYCSSQSYPHSHSLTHDPRSLGFDVRCLDHMPWAPLSLDHLSRFVLSPGSSPTAPMTRERFLANFTTSLMRHVVHATDVDLPLCLPCWTDVLVAQKKEAVRIAEDIVGLVAYAHPTEEDLILSCQESANVSTERTARECHTVENVNTEELFERLMVEVREAESRQALFEAECDFERSKLALLRTKRQEKESEANRGRSARNAREVKNFFEHEDALLGIAQRIENATSSCAFLTRSHAMLLAFPINTSGPVGTIAGLRLGQVPSPPSSVSRRSKSHSSTLECGNALSSSSPSSAAAVTRKGKCPPTASAVAPNSSGESTTLLHMLHLQQTYTQNLLGSREDRVSVAEINCACGFLLQLLKHLSDRHCIRLKTAAFFLNGDQSKVDALLTTRGNAPKPSGRPVDFFINEKLFSWKTFGTGCVLVSACVEEIASELKVYLSQLRYEAESMRVDHSTSLPATAHWDLEEFVGQLGSDDDLDWWVLHSTTPEDPPFVVSHGAVDGFSVRHGDTSDGVWTIAMKKLLSVVQWCVLASRDIDVLERLLKKKKSNRG